MKEIEWLKEEITEILLTSKKDGTNYFYYRDLKEKIYNAIDQLDEPDLPEIPDYVAEYIAHMKEEKTLVEVVYLSLEQIELGTGGVQPIDFWISRFGDKFSRAWLDGYIVEEKKYRIHFGNHKYAQRFNDRWLSSQITDKEFASTFTKEEIMKLDNSDLYWNNLAEEATE